MIVIRLVRVGRRNLAHFRLVVSEKRSKLGGRVIDLLGSYNPHKKELSGVAKEKVEDWVKKGAQVSASAARLLNKELGFNFPVREKVKPPKKKEEEKAALVSSPEGKGLEEAPVEKATERQEESPSEEGPKEASNQSETQQVDG